MFFKQYKSGSNHAYLLADEATGEAVAIDPITPQEILADIESNGFSLKYLFNTHGHGDHTSGNKDLLNASKARLCAHPWEGVGEDIALNDGMTLNAGNLAIKAIHTPGHTTGSVCLIANDELLFSGDTLFLSGCGNCHFGGNVKNLYESFANKLKPLPDGLKVFSGHNYTNINVPFSVHLFKTNAAIKKKEAEIAGLSQEIEPQSTLGEEKDYNPFFNFDNPFLQQDFLKLTGKQVPLGFELFRAVRTLKDHS